MTIEKEEKKREKEKLFKEKEKKVSAAKVDRQKTAADNKTPPNENIVSMI